jgi:hypothetical protein
MTAEQQYKGAAPDVDGMFPGESVAQAAASWAGWCEFRHMTGLALFLRKVESLHTPAGAGGTLKEQDRG